MFIAYQGDLAVQYGTDLVDLHNRCLFMQIDSIKEVDYDVCLHDGKIVPMEEIATEESIAKSVEEAKEAGEDIATDAKEE